MIRVYLAGAYSDDPMRRVIEAAKIQHRLMDLGFSVFCPHTAYHWANEIEERSYEEWMEACLEEVKRSDCVFRWSPDFSSGADREVALAEVEARPVFFSEKDLCEFWEIGVDHV